MGMFMCGRLEDGLRIGFSGDGRCRCTGTVANRCRQGGGLKQKRCADGREERGSPR